jgi:transcriptional regulator with XRE-family HTH domain
MSFSERLIEQRRTKGISQEQLVDDLGISRQAVSKWETDGSLPDCP